MAGHTMPDELRKEEPRNKMNDWEHIIDLYESQSKEFPRHIFPEWLETFINQVSESKQSPRDMGAMMALGTLATALMKKYRVQARADWDIPINIYAVVLAEPSERKSPTAKPFMNPIYEYEKELKEIHAEKEKVKAKKYSRLKIKYQAKKGQYQGLVKDNKDTTAIEQEIDELSDEMGENSPSPSPDLTVSNITPEEFDRKLYDNDETITIASSESSFFNDFGGGYTNGSSSVKPEGVISAYEGDYRKVDRVKDRENGTNGLILEDPLASIYIMVQPSVLENVHPELKERGLLSRFLYFKPISHVGHRKTHTEPIDPDVKQTYQTMIYRALDIEEDNKMLVLSEEARTLFDSFYAVTEESLRKDNTLDSIPGWGGKLPSQVLRIAGILHVAEHLEHTKTKGIPNMINEYTMQKAIDTTDYFIDHAKTTFGIVGVDEVDKTAKKIITLLSSHEKYKGKPKVSVRDVKDSIRPKGKNGSHLKEEALYLLEQNHYIREDPYSSKRMIEINPEFHEKYGVENIDNV